MKLYLQTILKLLVMSQIPSETPNYPRDHHHEYPNTTLALPNTKCVTLRVWEHAHMVETPLQSIISGEAWVLIMTPIY